MSTHWISRSLLTLALTTSAVDAAANDDRWASFAWEIRYLLFVDTADGRAEAAKVAKRINATDGKKGKNLVYLFGDELLGKSTLFITPGSPAIGTNLLTFDEQGNVTNDAEALRMYTGKLSTLGDLVLIHKDKPNAKPYELLFWMPALPDEPHSTAGPCTMLDKFRYEDRWKSGKYPGDFGCREWTAQLLNNERPYIDVTTYTRRGNFIGQFTGWSRFEDQPKPVIGMNGKTWLCLHECPSGETPGVIQDIKAWTSKHGYAMPVPPTFQPEYPDKNYDETYCEIEQKVPPLMARAPMYELH